MSHERKTQWTHRLEYLHALRERFTAARRYDRAYETYLTIQHAYDLWAGEIFMRVGSSSGLIASIGFGWPALGRRVPLSVA